MTYAGIVWSYVFEKDIKRSVGSNQSKMKTTSGEDFFVLLLES